MVPEAYDCSTAFSQAHSSARTVSQECTEGIVCTVCPYVTAAPWAQWLVVPELSPGRPPTAPGGIAQLQACSARVFDLIWPSLVLMGEEWQIARVARPKRMRVCFIILSNLLIIRFARRLI
jgi:hypothetical protein